MRPPDYALTAAIGWAEEWSLAVRMVEDVVGLLRMDQRNSWRI